VKAKLREGRSDAVRPNRGLGDGLRPRPAVRRSQDPALTIIDTFTRLSPAIDVRQKRALIFRRSRRRKT
jgi:hypothetical protein